MKLVVVALLALLALAGCSAPGVSPSDSDVESYCHKHPRSNFWKDYDGCVAWNEANR
jgi:uncharacterized lipoprotein